MSNFCSYSMARTSYIQWYDDDIRFVQDQHALYDLCSASSLQQQSSCRHVTPLGHIVLNPSQPIVDLTP